MITIIEVITNWDHYDWHQSPGLRIWSRVHV